MSFMVQVDSNTPINQEKPITGKELLERYEYDHRKNIVAWRVNNYLRPLGWVVDTDSHVEFVDTSTFEGMEVYRRSLSFLLVLACRRALSREVIIRHSINDAYYWEFEDVEVSEENIQAIREALSDLVKRDLPIEREVLPLDKAMKTMEVQGMPETANLFRWSSVDPVELYKCDGMYGFFYAPLAPSTGYLQVYEVKRFQPGLVLQFPTIHFPSRVPPFSASRKLSEVFLEYGEWLRTLGLGTMDSLHERVVSGSTLELVLISEALHTQRLSFLAEKCSGKNIRLICIAGPSGSGKTTMAQRLNIQLKVCGKKPFPISLDNFFLDRKDTPVDENGQYDFDTIDVLDLELLNRTLDNLFLGQKVTLPVFDFLEGEKRSGETVQLDDEHVVILEGIHGLNEKISRNVPREMKYKIFISPLTGISLDRHNRTSTTDNRLFRRLIRDYRTRGHSAEDTLIQWPAVIRGSMKYVFPFQDEADAMFNSSLPYELAVLKSYVEPVLHTVPRSSRVHGEARRLLSMLRYIPIIPSELIPNNSVLREFIGGSCFNA